MIQVTFLDLESKSLSEILACGHRRSFFPFCFGGERFFFLLSPPPTLSAKNRTPDRRFDSQLLVEAFINKN